APGTAAGDRRGDPGGGGRGRHGHGPCAATSRAPRLQGLAPPLAASYKAYARTPRIPNMAIEPEAKRRAHQWREEVYSAQPERDALFETISGQPIEPLYDAESLAGLDTECR